MRALLEKINLVEMRRGVLQYEHKNIGISSLLLGIGAALHFIIPGFFLGMKPDMMLLMMFLAIVLFPEKKNVLVVALGCGLLSALTTTFP